MQLDACPPEFAPKWVPHVFRSLTAEWVGKLKTMHPQIVSFPRNKPPLGPHALRC